LLRVPFSLLLMTLVIRYDKLSLIVSNNQLIDTNELPLFLKPSTTPALSWE